MKLICLMLSLTILFTSFSVYSQDPFDTTATGFGNYPFARKKWGFTLERNLSYRNYNEYFNDAKTGSSNNFGVNLDLNYFVANHFAIGLDVMADWSGSKNGTEIKSRDWMGYANFTYGLSLADGFNIYGRLGVGIGSDKTTIKTTSGTNTFKTDQFGVRATIGLPIHLSDGANTYLTPKVSYTRLTNDFDNGKETSNRFNIGLNLESYLGCDEMQCDGKTGFALSRDMYDQGHSWIGYYSKGAFRFGGITTTYDNLPGEQEEDFSSGHLKVDYNYYIFDYIALGAALGVRSQVEKTDNFKSTFTSFSFAPQVTLNAPSKGALGNLFLQFGGGIGTQKSEIEIGTNTSTDKFNTCTMGAGIGYNKFFARRTSFTTIIGYDWLTLKEDESNQKEKSRGINIEMGVRSFF